MTKNVRNEKGGSLPLAPASSCVPTGRPAVSSATPSAGDTQLFKAQMIAWTAPLSIAATSPDRFIAEVRE